MRSNPISILTRALASAAGCMLMSSCLQPADQIMERYGEGKLVFVKEPSVGDRSQDGDIAMASNPDEFVPGTDLVLLSPISPTGTVTNLTAQWTRATSNEGEWGAALDPEASFDGDKILFSMRKAGQRYSDSHPRFAIYEMNADGTNLVQLTHPDGYDDVDPAYIDNDHIVFGSTKNQIVDEYERRVVPQLFVAERQSNGAFGTPRQITFNQSHDQNPFVHSSGKIFFTRWDHLGDPNKMPLFSINPDGTGQFVAYGADETFGQGMTSGSRTFLEARELHDGGIVASLMERASNYEGGAICIIDLSKFSTAPKIITPSSSPYTTTQVTSDAIFKTPYPIMDGGVEKILVAQSAHETGGKVEGKVNYDLFIMDKDGGNLRLVHADPTTNDYDPVVLAPRTLPFQKFAMNPLVQNALNSNVQTGTFFDANVYSRQDDGQMQGDELKGRVRYVRVLSAVGTPEGCGFCSQTIGHTEFERQKVIGYTDVNADGSFSMEVPANTPMHVQTLDSNGMMLVNQLQWIDVMPGEQRICTGCHGTRDKDQDIKHLFVNTDLTVKYDLDSAKHFFASFANAQKATQSPAVKPDAVDFFVLQRTQQDYNSGMPNTTAGAQDNTLQHIFDQRCNSCHSAANATAQGGGLVLENQSDTSYYHHGTTDVYERLLSKDAYKTAGGDQVNYVNDRGARNSPLAWVLYNKQLNDDNAKTFRTPSYDHSAMWEKDSASGKINLFAKNNSDLLTLVEWMDMGAQFMNNLPKE